MLDDSGVSLNDATILYGNLAHPDKHGRTRRLLKLRLEVGGKPFSDEEEERYIEYFGTDNEARETVVNKLKRGELRAIGFVRGATPDAPPMDIYHERWRLLKPDFDTSTATSPGLVIDGILVFFNNCPASDLTPRTRVKPTAADEMKRVLAEVLKGRHFNTKKEAHTAVLKHLGIDGDAPRAYKYDNFIKQANAQLTEAGI
jgi:hypothetical protein